MAKARKPRDTHVYALREKRRIVGYGITDDLERRDAEHRAERTRFNSMNPVGPALTRESAEQREAQLIEGYKKTHGRHPRYNKEDG